MSNILWKNIHLCFSKLKCLPTIQPPSSPSPPPPPPSSTTTTTFKNFNNSLYDSYSGSHFTPSSTDYLFSSSSNNSVSDDSDTFPDLATVYASHRFFFSSPGYSNSIFESPDNPAGSSVTGGIEVRKYSADPYLDFRKSMQEMIEAREVEVDVRRDWEYLHELLLCYLQMNSKHIHKFIIDAFSDLIVCLLVSQGSDTDDQCYKTNMK